MNLTMASMDSEDDQARTRNIELNEFTIRGGKSLYKSIKLITSIILMVIVFSLSLFFHPFLMEGFLHYIAPFGSSYSYNC